MLDFRIKVCGNGLLHDLFQDEYLSKEYTTQFNIIILIIQNKKRKNSDNVNSLKNRK